MGDPFADIASVLRAVSHRVGSEIMVIGAHARDAVLAQLGAQPGRQTEDVDVVVGIPAGTSYREVVQALGTPVNEKGYTFRSKACRWTCSRPSTSRRKQLVSRLRALLGAMVERRLESDALLHDMGLSGPPPRLGPAPRSAPVGT